MTTQSGLIEEIHSLRQHATTLYGDYKTANHEEGIFQAIGYKEFSAIPSDDLQPESPLFRPAVEQMQLATRQYAKKQLKWIKKQMLPAILKARSKGGEVYIYVLPAGDSSSGIKLLRGKYRFRQLSRRNIEEKSISVHRTQSNA
jgi:tRNA dimethylallyltransferase